VATFALMKYHFFLGLIIYIAFYATLILSSAFIVIQFAPTTTRSSIPEIKAYLNGKSHLLVYFFNLKKIKIHLFAIFIFSCLSTSFHLDLWYANDIWRQHNKMTILMDRLLYFIEFGYVLKSFDVL
jgi:hypothetical protein